jgi:hypothetical protein
VHHQKLSTKALDPVAGYRVVAIIDVAIVQVLSLEDVVP